ncbi:hypothetical protein SAMN02910369_01298 [Lachnospiraceae bacterium NE2001]|nr:hypothetical protein SAMN02910369_01298 [Lachnospiraceae bacterium NE2001]
MNDYYENLDGDSPSFNEIDNSIEVDRSVLSVFTVSLFKKRLFATFILMLTPLVFFLWMNRLLVDMAVNGMRGITDFVVVFLFAIFLMGGYFFLELAGKRIEVVGKCITIRKYYFIKDIITLNDITRSEIITGLYAYSKFGGHAYSKIVIYYGGGKKVSVEDYTHDGWQKLADYLSWNGKAKHIDGTNKTIEKIGEWIIKHNRDLW